MELQTVATLIREGTKILSHFLQSYAGRQPQSVTEILKDTETHDLTETHEKESQRVTTDETIQYQKRQLVKELTLLEGHLQEGCAINGKACDCCLVPRTRIYGNPMPVSIETPPNRVITHQGVMHPVIETFEREYQGDLNELSVGYTSFPLLLTPEHPVLVARNVRRRQRDIWRKAGISEKGLQWLSAEDVTNRDFMVFPRLKGIKDRDDISIQMAELLGWYVAEGSIAGTRVTFSLSKKEIGNIARVKELISNLFGVEPKCYEKPTAIHICYTKREKIAIFKEFGVGARQKHLPLWFFYLPFAKQKAFIMAAIAGDGSQQKYQYVYTTTSEVLIYQFRLLLFRMGILHSLSTRAIGDSFINGRRILPNGPRYDIFIAGDAARSLGLICGQRTSGNHGWISDNYAFLPVKNNRKVPYTGKVFNIAVDGDESYVTAHGAIHNCEKHPIKIEGLAQEAAGMTPEPVFRKLAKWTQEISPITTEAAAASGKYAEKYPELAIEARTFRKALMPGKPVEKEVENEVPAAE